MCPSCLDFPASNMFRNVVKSLLCDSTYPRQEAAVVTFNIAQQPANKPPKKSARSVTSAPSGKERASGGAV